MCWLGSLLRFSCGAGPFGGWQVWLWAAVPSGRMVNLLNPIQRRPQSYQPSPVFLERVYGHHFHLEHVVELLHSLVGKLCHLSAGKVAGMGRRY